MLNCQRTIWINLYQLKTFYENLKNLLVWSELSAGWASAAARACWLRKPAFTMKIVWCSWLTACSSSWVKLMADFQLRLASTCSPNCAAGLFSGFSASMQKSVSWQEISPTSKSWWLHMPAIHIILKIYSYDCCFCYYCDYNY